MDYKTAGVDIEAGYKSVELMKAHVKGTMRPEVLGGLGGFSGAFSLSSIKDMEEPVLLSGTDGCGTKVKLAIIMDKHDTIGIDAVAMCVNDVLAQGAEPLIFLDYVAIGHNIPEKVEAIVAGVAEGCRQAGCALIGGETAEMPGMYKPGDYDVAGFCVGIVEKDQIIDGSKIKAGHKIIALPSSGFHSNGFSLVRKIFPDFNEEFEGKPLYETLLVPTRLYFQPVHKLLEEVKVDGIAHITGGGIIENIPRIIPQGLCAEINTSAIRIPSVMLELEKRGNIDRNEMYGTFNMGVGMVIVIDANHAEKVLNLLDDAYEIGQITEGEEIIVLN